MCRDDGKVEASNARDLYDAAAVHKEGFEGMHRRSRSEWISGGNGQMSGWSVLELLASLQIREVAVG